MDIENVTSDEEIKGLTCENVEQTLEPSGRDEDLCAENENMTSSDLNMQHWQTSKYAVGPVNISWEDEKNKKFCSDSFCLRLTGIMCHNKFFQARRIGNMVVFSKDDKWMCGPFWPMLAFVTYPLIFGVSGWCYVSKVSKMEVIIQLAWFIMTLFLILSLALTSFRNPGIWLRHSEKESPNWIWNEQARTWRPRKARYDSECGCVIEDFDHTCPWTGMYLRLCEMFIIQMYQLNSLYAVVVVGTAIGKGNMKAFHSFVGSVFLCLLIDVLLLSGTL